ncbi:unnamed protein product [Closterium sp. Naga37s-1]|nr:unnamed protein product [Closterium sp. Naga37s-1]
MPGLAPDLAGMADMAPLLSVNPYGSMSGCIRLRTPEPVPYDHEERSEGNSQGMRIFPRDVPLVSRAECSEGASCSEDAPRERAAHKEDRVAVAGFDVRFFEVVCDMLVLAPACDADAPGRDVVASHEAAACNDTAATAVACAADGSDSILRARIDEQEAQMAQLEEENHSLRDVCAMHAYQRCTAPHPPLFHSFDPLSSPLTSPSRTFVFPFPAAHYFCHPLVLAFLSVDRAFAFSFFLIDAGVGALCVLALHIGLPLPLVASRPVRLVPHLPPPPALFSRVVANASQRGRGFGSCDTSATDI